MNLGASSTTTRTYRQAARAEATARNTERIVTAALELFVERPFEQVTLAAVAERAGVGLQTVVRRVGTKDGLVEAVNAWVMPEAAASLGPPDSPDPRTVAAAFRRHYERWGRIIERTLHQEESSPALAANAEAGRVAHRTWVGAAFASVLDPLPAPHRRVLHARLVAVTGVEVWRLLTAHEHLGPDEAENAVCALVAAVVAAPRA